MEIKSRETQAEIFIEQMVQLLSDQMGTNRGG
jgi:hypothetical protein